jgi:hypothetical protein
LKPHPADILVANINAHVATVHLRAAEAVLKAAQAHFDETFLLAAEALHVLQNLERAISAEFMRSVDTISGVRR